MFSRALLNHPVKSHFSAGKHSVLSRTFIKQSCFLRRPSLCLSTSSRSSTIMSPPIHNQKIPSTKSFDNRIAFQDKPLRELFRSLVVYKLCSVQWLVNNVSGFIELAEKYHLTRPIYWIIAKTFFVQFCGGETDKQCIDTMTRLKKHGIGTILSLSIESDLDQGESLSTDAESFFSKEADRVTQMYLECIQTASKQSNSCVAIKVTGLTDPGTLKNLSLTYNSLDNAFNRSNAGRDGKLGKSDFFDLISGTSGGSDKTSHFNAFFDKLDSDKDGSIDRFDVFRTFALDSPEILRPLTENENLELSQHNIRNYNQLLTRLEQLCKSARKHNVKLLIDAEQTYFQPAIDYISMRLSSRYNKLSDGGSPIIFNTYQMYLKDSMSRLQRDYELSRRNEFVFASKLVRGAYMISERTMAERLGYSNPVHDSIEDTHRSYDNAVEFLLDKLHESKSNGELSTMDSPVSFIVASHNQESIIKTCEKMERYGISVNSGTVSFGQLYGMCDQITYTLASLGYPVYKYLAYGKIDEVMPFLIRRAQENSSVLDGRAPIESKMLWNEIINRLKFR
ncbi:5144_t:CDS:2 [Acaulospora morrowiae]|uniref:Proline dehydrogenase n=1 Tax=Acaulospora morrowiae TaxID=94023 RepID=A0A9N8V153_9GLOM|nr:5144_t:CDS:2 [Acaulospora morrowiae]